ncbi:MAG: hypothetical protein ACTHJ6_14530 [Oryzihumus sp.]|jgi:hypothetical protein
MPAALALSPSSWQVLAASAALAVTGLMLIDLPADSSARAEAVKAIFAQPARHRGTPQAIGTQP